MTDKLEEDDWQSEMYGDNSDADAFVKNTNLKNNSTQLTIKSVNKNFVELRDAKNNPITVPSEKYIEKLEEKIDRLEEIIRVQNTNLGVLSGKLGTALKDIETLKKILEFFDE